MRLNARCLLELPVTVCLQQSAAALGPARQHPVSKERARRFPLSTLLWPTQTTEKKPKKNLSPVAHRRIERLWKMYRVVRETTALEAQARAGVRKRRRARVFLDTECRRARDIMGEGGGGGGRGAYIITPAAPRQTIWHHCILSILNKTAQIGCRYDKIPHTNIHALSTLLGRPVHPLMQIVWRPIMWQQLNA